MEFKVVKSSPFAAKLPFSRSNGAPRNLSQSGAWLRLSRCSPKPLRLHSIQSPLSTPSSPGTSRIDKSDVLTLESIRHSLIRQEDSIIFSLLERAQFAYNADTYDSSAFLMDGFDGSLVEFMVRETEKLHAKVGRYKSPDEHPFFPEDLPEPLLPPMQYPEFVMVHSWGRTEYSIRNHTCKCHSQNFCWLVPPHLNKISKLDATLLTKGVFSPVLHPAAGSININKTIWNMYFDDLLPSFTKEGSDGNCGSSAVCDTICLQALSKRMHYGKYVAEAKFRANPEWFEPAIKSKDTGKLMELLTYPKVEQDVLHRVETKASTFGQEVNMKEDGEPPVYKIQPSVVAKLYGTWVMPLTKEVQVQYLLKRLD